MENKPRLYIVMRSDLWDMNPGKGMAQAAHAQALFDLREKHSDFLVKYSEWRGDGPECIGFGVTTVLSATASEINNICRTLEHADWVVDPTYPYRNWYGETFTRSELTCAWAFPMDEVEFEYMRQFPLHK